MDKKLMVISVVDGCVKLCTVEEMKAVTKDARPNPLNQEFKVEDGRWGFVTDYDEGRQWTPRPMGHWNVGPDSRRSHMTVFNGNNHGHLNRIFNELVDITKRDIRLALGLKD